LSRVADVKVARRYAGALFNAAQKLGRVDAVQTDLQMLVLLWNTTPALSRSLESPLIPGDRKHAVVDELFGKDTDPLTRSFLHLLISKRREDILRTVEAEFRILSDEARGLIRAEATVAAPLSDPDRAALVEGLKTRTGKQIELEVRVDPVVLGGVVVRMQDTVIDGSVRGALERLREQMLLER
jgi:F-type H+-transporting ATPase subunit delta